MWLIFKYFLDICLFRANAEHAPSSQFFMVATLAAYGLLSILILMTDYSVIKAVSTVFIGIVIMVGFAWAALWIRNYLDRSRQTITALAGSGIIFDLISLPLVVLSTNFPQGELVFPLFLLYLLRIWNIAVIGNIMKSVLSVPFWAGIFIAFVYAVVYTRVFSIILATGS
jgi:hypothetical protein